MDIFQTFIYAFFVGLLPALIWLWFWLHEDKTHPEPRSLLAFTFTTGMAMIFLAIPLEAFFAQNISSGLGKYFAWASIEELLKFSAAFIVAFHSMEYDEPLDAVIYMICAALGFAALENTLFILNNISPAIPALNGGFVDTVFLTNIRFIGANLLHVLASSVIGIALALSFNKTRKQKIVWVGIGIVCAIVLHTLFNLFIIDGSGLSIFLVFSIVWIMMIGFMLIFEKIKNMHASTIKINHQ